jgi:hypothetical protein
MIGHRRRVILLAVVAVLVAGTRPVAAQDEMPRDPPATALRLSLDRALGEHAFLLGEVVRSGIGNLPDFNAAAAALEANTTDVVALIEDVYGADAADAFAEHWRNHVAYIVDYGRALADGDPDAAQLAQQQLERYVDDFSGFLAEALPALAPDAVEGLIGGHVQQLEHVASFEMGEVGEAYGAIRETYAHMFMVGDSLAEGIIGLHPNRFSGHEQAFSPATTFRLELDRLLGEHTHLAAVYMRAMLRQEQDAPSIGRALAGNTADLGAMIADLYGAKAGEAFVRLWNDHVATYTAYINGLADGDDAATSAAIDELETYRSEFTDYLADANPHLSAAAFETLVGEHIEHLVAQAEAYAADRYDQSFEIGRQAYRHAGELARSLAGAIVDQFPHLLPNAATHAPPRDWGASLIPTVVLATGVLLVGLGVGLAITRPSRIRRSTSPRPQR